MNNPYRQKAIRAVAGCFSHNELLIIMRALKLAYVAGPVMDEVFPSSEVREFGGSAGDLAAMFQDAIATRDYIVGEG